MITVLEAVGIVWKRLNESPLKTAINGGIYKQKRPLNSGKEDAVVNSLPINSEQLQEGVLNVNLHVPNLVIVSNGIQDSTQPDFVRLQALAEIAIPLLTDVWIEDVHYTVQQHVVIDEEEINEHYINIRLEFYSTNI